MTPLRFIALDMETFGEVDLPKEGLHKYVSSPNFRPLVACTRGPEPNDHHTFDFIEDPEGDRQALIEMLGDWPIVAHNAGFERAVLRRMGIDLPASRFIDSAALARFHGAAGKLEAAAPQLLGTDKMPEGWDLIKLFSIPKDGQQEFDLDLPYQHEAEWQQFKDYCALDALLSWELADKLLPITPQSELVYNSITMEMNSVGWHVDVLLAEEMQRRYLANVAAAEAEFRSEFGETTLNLNSHPQLVKWCADRGVRATSFNEQSVAKMLKLLTKKLESMNPADPKHEGYRQVVRLLETKQVMGGTSLKKLETLLRQIGVDDRLRHNYLHCGAGATARTTGTGVQLQNLPRLHGQGDDVDELFLSDTDWDNSKLAANLRQVFCSSDGAGRILVGDFTSVESMALAYQSDEEWKLDAYADGQPVYKMLASKMLGVPVDLISHEQRQTGKVGELSCGYGAGPGAVEEFSKNMGVPLTEAQASALVKDWRDACPHTVMYWHDLHNALVGAVTTGMKTTIFRDRIRVEFIPYQAPESLQLQVGNPDLLSLRLRMVQSNGLELLTRVIHGVEVQGRNVVYWKPSQRKTGDLWTDRYTDPKTKRTKVYTVYGGKLAGLLTQSLCREVFFQSLVKVQQFVDMWPNVKIIGQFHDEIVVDWTPDPEGLSLETTMTAMKEAMSTSVLTGFPLSADIKSAYRYVK